MSDIEDEFATSLNQGLNGNYLIAALNAYCADPDFPEFTVTIRNWKADERQYDGRFHPSTHALWTLRQLYLYLTAPQVLAKEFYGLAGIFSVTQGKFWHEFVQTIGLATGRLVQAEVPIDVEYTNVKGHADGMLDNGEALEIKTGSQYIAPSIYDEVSLRQKKPGYWAQTQDYLAALGVEIMRYLVIKPGHPWSMHELVVHADPQYQSLRANQYRAALEASRSHPDPKDGLPLLPACCAPMSKEAKACPVRLACDVGRMGL